MTFFAIAKALEASVLVEGRDYDTALLAEVLASDLMSEVLTVEKEDFLLVTTLTSDQAARTADIIGARGLVLTGGKRPQPGLLRLAGEQEMTLLSTQLTTFRACWVLGNLLAAEGRLP